MPRHGSRLETGKDDFTSISGVGRAISRRLHDAGITTYGQLAALSVDEIAKRLSDIAAITPNRIRRENWSGQAAALAATKPPGGMPHELSAEASDGTAEVQSESPVERSTNVAASASGEPPAGAQEDKGAPLDAPGLTSEPVTAPAVEAGTGESKRESQQPVAPNRSPHRWRSVAGMPVMVERDPRTVQAGEPFTIRLTLDSTNAAPALTSIVRYATIVVAQQLGGARRRTVAKGAGLFTPPTLRIELSCAGLPAGAHRLEAIVELFESSFPRPSALLGGREQGLLTVV